MRNKNVSNGQAIAPGSRLSSKSRELVPTTIDGYSSRQGGRYDSSATLPEIDLVFDRLLNSIRAIHIERERTPEPFESLWSKTCKSLKKSGNANAYRHNIQTALIRKSKDRNKLLEQYAREWASSTVHTRKDGSQFHLSSDPGKVQELQKKLDELPPEATLSVEDTLGIAIAFWIEARNSHNSDDGERAFYCLMECSFFIGMASGPKTQSEAASDNGTKGRRTKPRDDMAELALEVVKEFDNKAKLRDSEDLAGRISHRICSDPHHAEILRAYDVWAKNNRNAGKIEDRLTETLLRWGTEEESPYLHFRIAFQKLVSQTPPKKRINYHKQ